MKTCALRVAGLVSAAILVAAPALARDDGHYAAAGDSAHGPRQALTVAWMPAADASGSAVVPAHSGHYAWQTRTGRGPREPLLVTRRVWVADR